MDVDVEAPFLAPELIAGPDDPAAGLLAPGARVRLAASSCPSCKRTVFPPIPSCPVCGGRADRAALSCEGQLRGFTSVQHPPPGCEVPVPYQVGLVNFSEGLAIMGLLQGDGEAAVSVGDPIETVVLAVGDELTYGYRPLVAPRGD